MANGAYFSQYTLGWPLVLLASSLVLGTPSAAVVLGTVLAVVGAVAVTREIVRRDDVAIAVGVLVLASPVVVIQAGVYLGYLFTMGLGNLALVLGLVRFPNGPTAAGDSSRPACCWDAILLTRPFDAVLWGAILVMGAVVLHRRDGLRRLWPVVLAGLPFVVATLAYNMHVTGGR